MATEPFGKRVRDRRIHEGLSQEELAEKVRISRNYLSQIERGQATNLSLQVVDRINEVLGLKTEAKAGTGDGEQQLPPGLAEYARLVDLSPDDIAMLARLQYRGRQPTTPRDWAILYNIIRATLGSMDQE